jgi:hypothetical protein
MQIIKCSYGPKKTVSGSPLTARFEANFWAQWSWLRLTDTPKYERALDDLQKMQKLKRGPLKPAQFRPKRFQSATKKIMFDCKQGAW